MGKEPAQPHALPADSVKRVVPVTAAGVWQPVPSETAVYTAFERRAGVLKHRRALCGLFRALITVALLVLQRRGGEIRLLDGAQLRLSRGLDVFAQRPYEPQQVVRAARAHAAVAVRVRVPPVQHVALGVLMAAAVEYALSRVTAVYEQQVYAVLKLVAEAERAAALVYAAAPLEAAGDSLIDRPAVHIVLHRTVSAAQRKRPEESCPARGYGAQERARGVRCAQLAQLRLRAAAAAEHSLRTGV